jgi:23S rRNA (pseudouridine1915-N3)-methyltransferase
VGGRSSGEGRLKVKVVSIGKDKSGLFSPAVDEYAKRLEHYGRFSFVELPPKRNAAEEAELLFAKISNQEMLVALDERGELWDSVELSRFLAKAQNQARDVTFVIGGDEGLDPRVRERATKVLALSKMTLPHRLARVVLAEQLYRAMTLIRGEPYHK